MLTLTNDEPAIELTADEKRAITALKRVAAHWPKTLWLYATGLSVNIMRCGPDGEHMVEAPHGGVDPAFVVDTIDIPNDGGDW